MDRRTKRRDIARYRDSSKNLRTQLSRIIRRAGIKPWPKLFHNLRATRETELAETYPAHVVCAWIGNSQAVTQKHYRQITDEHFERGARCDALQIALQSVQESPCTDANTNNDERAETPVNSGVFADVQSDSYLDKMAGLGVEGLEHDTVTGCKSSQLPTSLGSRAAECAALAELLRRADRDLVMIVVAWPQLSGDMRQQILNVLKQRVPGS